MTSHFDLTPHPRVLQMLGEISLDQWKCLAELIDNSIDGFMSAKRNGTPIKDATVEISIPTADHLNALVSVRDNGPGMTIEHLENAVRAGWTGNDPVSNLGLFGMGFNIATARMGVVTEVWTTRKGDLEWSGLEIDLEALRQTRSYHVPRKTRAKLRPDESGTEIRVTRLKPEQRAFLAKAVNISRIRKQLSKVYSALLLDSAASFRLGVNGTPIHPQRHCVWEDSRSVTGPDGNIVHAVERFDFELQPRKYCPQCMAIFVSNESTCPRGNAKCEIREMERRIRGWVGLQRYSDETDFGIDFIRNGRKIEMQNKDLFDWSDGDRVEREYPIDDQRFKGRFVGEIHIDHCRVSYTKDRCERDDPAWNEMVRLVRGEGPLQPLKAKSYGFTGNTSPLFRLYQAFRRNTPQGKAGRWSRVLVVPDNARAFEMAQRFHKGEPTFQTDEEWWKLVQEKDAEVIGIPTGPVPVDPAGNPIDELPLGFIDQPSPSGPKPTAPPIATAVTPAEPYIPPRTPIHELSREFSHPTLKVQFLIEAFAAGPGDPDLPTGEPWHLKLDDPGTRTFLFVVNLNHEVYRSTSFTPMDALLIELSIRATDFLKPVRPDIKFQSVLAEFRNQYSGSTRIFPEEIIANAVRVIREIGHSIVGKLPSEQYGEVFASLSVIEREHITREIMARGGLDVKAVIAAGEFLDYASPATVHGFFLKRPDLFFDGQFWDDPYASLDFGIESVTLEARKRVIRRYDNYLADAVVLASLAPRDVERMTRDALIRASLSVKLLRPDKAE